MSSLFIFKTKKSIKKTFSNIYWQKIHVVTNREVLQECRIAWWKWTKKDVGKQKQRQDLNTYIQHLSAELYSKYKFIPTGIISHLAKKQCTNLLLLFYQEDRSVFYCWNKMPKQRKIVQRYKFDTEIQNKTLLFWTNIQISIHWIPITQEKE